MNFSFLRRLHLSFLLPAVLTTLVILVATCDSLLAQEEEESFSEPKTSIIQPQELAAPLSDKTMTWEGNIEFDYPNGKMKAIADKAEYYQSEQKVVLSGNVRISQAGEFQEVETVTFFITGKFTISSDSHNLPITAN